MSFKNRLAYFLYLFIVGLLSLYCVYAVGVEGNAVLAAIAIIPFIFKRSSDPPAQRIWQLYYAIGKWSFLLTGATILTTYFFFDYLPVNSHDRGVVFLTIAPWFAVIVGFVGFTMSWQERKNLS